MQVEPRMMFRFGCGGYFEGYDLVEVFEVDSGYKLSYKCVSFDAKETFVDLPEVKVEKLLRFMDSEVNDRWYCHYVNPCVLDGTQWELHDGRFKRYGSNFFPKGFGRLMHFLSCELGCEGLERYWDVPEDELDEHQELAILAAYGAWHLDSGRQEDCEGGPEDDWDNNGEGVEDVEMTARQLYHDLYLFLGHYPRYKDYGRILAENGIPLDVGLIKSHDVRDASPECIVAMVLAMSRAGRFGCKGIFDECVRDGTFGKWLRRLRETLELSPWFE